MKNKKPTIFVSVASAITLRNVMIITDSIVNKLSIKYKVVVLVPKDAVHVLKDKYDGNNICFESVSLHIDFNFLQKIFNFLSSNLINTGSHAILGFYGVRNDRPVSVIKKFIYPIKIFIAYTLGIIPIVRKKIFPYLDKLIFTEELNKDLFNRYEPKLVFLANMHTEQDLTILREAKKYGIKTIGMPGSWDHFPKKYVSIKADRVLVWHNVMKKEAIDYHKYDKSDISVVGVPYYDFFLKKNLLMSRKEFCTKINFDASKKIIFFASATVYSPEDGDIVDIIFDAIKKNKITKPSQLFIRPYPGIESEHVKFDKFDSKPSVYVDWVDNNSSFDDPWLPTIDEVIWFMNILYHADVIINTYSSIAIESTIYDKSSIVVNFDGYKTLPYNLSVKRFKKVAHYKHVISTNGAIFVNDSKELIETLNKVLDHLNYNHANVKILKEMMAGILDGHTAERVVKEVGKFV